MPSIPECVGESKQMRIGRTAVGYIAIFVVVALFCGWITSVAYSSAGRVVPDAEATELAVPTPTEVVDLEGQGEYQVGDEAVVFGGSYGALVPLFSGPGARFFTSQVLTGSPVTILELGIDSEGVIWYLVEGLAGSGWILGENLQPPPAE
jgi:hypothetical protein